MDTFGEWLRQQRNIRKLTRNEFAERVGCSIALLRKIEDGERRPSAQIAELIANCLDIPPSERSTFVKVARGELGVARVSAISKPNDTTTAPHIHLPVFPTPLIGRQPEVEEITQLLRDPQCRLLTLVGAGGIGKTRLAVGLRRTCDAFVDGVYFVTFPGTLNPFSVPVIADAIRFAARA
jgi:transcriptional regulator with XRE-family HTH domain